ncbi:murein hydrolase activator EnvC family protein [Streptomyces monticola]|uniref:Murein hydrolase activator EnvC family protein n=1 Tax=Streptomyces monticola TaxID=2666263 RepID=A0ABW2JSL2_9ACTN
MPQPSRPTTYALATALLLAAATTPANSSHAPQINARDKIPPPREAPHTPAGDRTWPVGPEPPGRPRILHAWRPPATAYGPGHRGVDLAAPPGSPVRAAAPGRVTFAGRVAGRGVISVDHTGTGTTPLRTTYEPVRATVEKGTRVTTGDPLGTLEDGPFHCTQPCLHWGLRRAKTYLNPLTLLPPWLLRRGPSRLLPVFGVPEMG